MPRKKKEPKVESTKIVVEPPLPPAQPTPEKVNGVDRFEVQGPDVRDGLVHLSRVDLLELELRQSRILALQNKRRLLRFEYAEVRQQQEREMFSVETAFRANSEEYVEYKKRLGEVYDVDFAKATYDDSTGRLMIEGASILASTD